MALPVSRPVGDWPLILCGPILRRVTPNSVAVFVALKSKARVVLELYRTRSPGPFDAPNQSVAHDTVALGANLHVCVVEWRSNTPLVSNQIYGYDLLITVPGGSGQRLGDIAPNLLTGPYKLGYDERLPSFVLPPNLRDLVVVHGSCRKPHGNKPDAGADALAILDDVIAGSHASPLRRPHHLILTGDQIYADDVSIALLETLRSTARDLLGWAGDETFPPAVAGGARLAPGDPLVIPGQKRREYIRKHTKLSSDHVDGHLMFLGEFYAMYLFAWSDALWPRETGAANPSVRLPSAQELDSAVVSGDVDTDRGNVHAFAADLPRVRRALANVPSLMMFDDHEVTDDWYLDGKWAADARADAASRQIMRNALAGYAVFQDWGNQPENYRSGTLGLDILNALRYYEQSRLAPIESQPTMLDALLDLRPQRTPLAQRMRWDWQYSQAGADYQIVALDTRTFRGYAGVNKDASSLIGSDPAKTDEQLVADALPMGFQLLSRKPADGRVTIVVSPAPVIGHPFVEMGQRAMVMGGPNSVITLQAKLASDTAELQRLQTQVDPTSRAIWQSRIDSLIDSVRKLPRQIAEAKVAASRVGEECDNEAWSANRHAFEDLLRRLSGFGRVVILSGDVHYAFSAQMAYFPTSANAGAARLVQFCSSALRNEARDTRMLATLGFEGLRSTLGWLGFDRDLTVLASDFKRGMDAAVLAPGVDPAMAANASRLFFQVEMNDRLKRPAVIPNAHYMEKTVFEKMRDLARDPVSGRDLTAWRYSITYLQDTRDVSSRTEDWASLAAALGASANATHRNRMFVGSERSIVGQNNVGLVRFSASIAGGAIDQVRQRLYWQAAAGTTGQATRIAMFTEHLAKLSIPGTDELPEVMP